MKDEKAQVAVRLHDPVKLPDTTELLHFHFHFKLPEIKLRISMHLANTIKAFQ